MKINKHLLFVAIVVALAVAQLVVVLFSWVASVLFPSMEVNSLLGSEGLRWLLSTYERNTNTSVFFYLLLVCFAMGAFISSGVAGKLLQILSFKRGDGRACKRGDGRAFKRGDGRADGKDGKDGRTDGKDGADGHFLNRDERWGVGLFLAVVALAVVLCVVYAVYPRSFLLSVDGGIYPGPYLPAALVVVLMAVVFGSFLYVTIVVPSQTMAHQLSRFLRVGLTTAVPFIIIYYELMELICSILYIFRPL